MHPYTMESKYYQTKQRTILDKSLKRIIHLDSLIPATRDILMISVDNIIHWIVRAKNQGSISSLISSLLSN